MLVEEQVLAHKRNIQIQHITRIQRFLGLIYRNSILLITSFYLGFRGIKKSKISHFCLASYDKACKYKVGAWRITMLKYVEHNKVAYGLH